VHNLANDLAAGQGRLHSVRRTIRSLSRTGPRKQAFRLTEFSGLVVRHRFRPVSGGSALEWGKDIRTGEILEI
jgi:hypothetical protein